MFTRKPHFGGAFFVLSNWLFLFEFWYMATYQEIENYFQNLAQTHPLIKDGVHGQKFFRMNIEEFITGSISKLPEKDKGPFLVLINFIRDFNGKGITKDKKQIMFFVMQSYLLKNWEDESLKRQITETVVEEILLKMKHDSVNNSPIFNRGLDSLDRVRIIPAELKTSAGSYVGWQVVFEITHEFNKCFDPNIWI